VIAKDEHAAELKGFRSVDKWSAIEDLASELELEFLQMPRGPLPAPAV
jgi:hypothetical protein